jgi:hypothetical protein
MNKRVVLRRDREGVRVPYEPRPKEAVMNFLRRDREGVRVPYEPRPKGAVRSRGHERLRRVMSRSSQQ